MRLSLFGSVLIPLSLMICPRNENDCFPKAHFVGFSFRFADLSRGRAMHNRLRCSSNKRPNMIMSSRYAKQVEYSIPLNTKVIRRINVAGAVASPNGINCTEKDQTEY